MGRSKPGGSEGISCVGASVRRDIGYALYFAQLGDKHPAAKPLKGFGGAGVLEIVEDHDGNTYRAIYTLRLGEVVYVLHVFQKKAKRGSATPKHHLDMIRERLRHAEQMHKMRINQ